jgi:hypothetical protein
MKKNNNYWLKISKLFKKKNRMEIIGPVINKSG